MSETQEEKCRVIAEWLGWKRFGWKRFKQELGFECLIWYGVPPKQKGLEPVPDFYTSESASALILEKMPGVELTHCRFATYEIWICKADLTKSSAYLEHEGVRASDRKTAIAEAALRFIESEAKK